MYPVAFHLGSFSIPSYGLLLVAALLAGMWIVLREAKRLGISQSVAFDGVMVVEAAAFIGAHLLYWVAISSPLRAGVAVRGGAVYYGALAGAIPALVIFARRHGIRLTAALDAAAPAAALGHGIGRVGCFLAGCCWGRPTDLPWGVVFSDPRSFAVRGVPLHPSQLYETLLEGALFAWLWRRRMRAHREGSQALIYGAGYGAGRFLIEFTRGDPGRGMLVPGILSLSQGLSFVLLVVAGSFALLLRRAETAAGVLRARRS